MAEQEREQLIEMIEQAAQVIADVRDAHLRLKDDADSWSVAKALADAGLLRTPGCYDPIECGHEAALGEAEAKMENSVDLRQVAWYRVDGKRYDPADVYLAMGDGGRYVSIPVPPPDELVERMAKAAYEFPGGWLSVDKKWDDFDQQQRAKDQIMAALRALGEAQSG